MGFASLRKATICWSPERKSTSPTRTLWASAPGGIFRMKALLNLAWDSDFGIASFIEPKLELFGASFSCKIGEKVAIWKPGNEQLAIQDLRDISAAGRTGLSISKEAHLSFQVGGRNWNGPRTTWNRKGMLYLQGLPRKYQSPLFRLSQSGLGQPGLRLDQASQQSHIPASGVWELTMDRRTDR